MVHKKEKSLEKQNRTSLLDIPRTLRTEFNFLKYPFFDLSKDSERAKIKIEEWIDSKEGNLHILWLVTRNIESKFPGDFEKRLHRAIEQIINATPKPIENPLRLGSLRYIAMLMGINPDSGKNREDIKQAFKNIVKTTIESEGTYQVKQSGTKQFINDTFHLYDRVILTGEELPSGQTASCVYLMLGTWYLKNINNNYVVPLDWRFYNQLTGSTTTRMYEFLSIYFFAAMERRGDYHDLKYSQICDFFPLIRQDQKWKAKKQLKRAHDSLLEAEYLAKIEWLDINQNDNWVIRYWVGPRAREEYKINKTEYRIVEDIRPIALPERRHRRSDEDREELVSGLKERGVAEKKAERLVENYSREQITEKIKVFDYLVTHKSNLITKNPPGWLVKAIEGDYAPPIDFETDEQKRQREEGKAEEERRIEEKRKRDEYKQWIETSVDHKIYWDLEKWKKEVEEIRGEPPKPDEVGLKREELISDLPTNEEMQVKIFGEVIFPEPDDLFR